MNQFSLKRLGSALGNDLLAHAKSIGYSTLGLFVVGLMIHMGNLKEANSDSKLFEIMFGLALVPGLFFTCVIWSDMHHPLARFHYLMLPYSNLERFLSRYLLTAPLYWLYVLGAFTVFEVLANALSSALLGVTLPLIALDSPVVSIATLLFFSLHILAFAGAIRFRNYALARTALAVFLYPLALLPVAMVALPIIYWEYFDGLQFREDIVLSFGSLEAVAEQITPQQGEAILLALGTLACAWVLYLAWLLLKDHEVHDGL
jgi:hypothetical protein